jgi:DNA polymerase-3 subunit epsilon
MAIGAAARQGSFGDLGRPLHDVTFVVVDLETTGGSAADDAITEIGAVKTRGGEVLGEFQTLVDPGLPVPPFITVLTGITEAMLAAAPRLGQVLPSFLEWARGSVLVAHNAPFDTGFLRAGCAALGLDWPGFEVLDTARLARQALSPDEVPNCKLATLARRFSPSCTPTHRALDDARATVAVLHGLLERLGSLGVTSLEEARAFSSLVTPAQRRKRRLADGLPHAAGVYFFRDRRGRVLYVGTSRDLASRVRQYFVSAERRGRILEMVGIAEQVDHAVCAHDLEARVRELRLIGAHKPPYNRRSRFPERAFYLVLTDERFPRLSVTRRCPGRGVAWVGPFGSTRAAELARDAVYEVFAIRRCSQRIAGRGSGRRCALAELGRCGAPCDGGVDEAGYAQLVRAVREVLERDPGPVLEAALTRIRERVAAERFEDAAAVRDRTAAFLRARLRRDRICRLAAAGRLLAARPAGGGYELAAVERGRLTAAAFVPPGAAPGPYLASLEASAPAPPLAADGAWPPGAAAYVEEVELVADWLDRGGVRLVRVSGSYAEPVGAAARYGWWLARAAAAPDGRIDPAADRRGLRPVR